MEDIDIQHVLALIDGLSPEQRDLVKKTLDDGNDLDRVIAIIESRVAENLQCVHCHSSDVKKWGKSCCIQRYRCFSCGKTFNPLTGTPLAYLRKRDRWLRMALALKEGLSVRKTAEQCNISVPTAFRWRHRFLKNAASDKPVKLHGIAEADETYFLESFKGSRQLDRPARKRGGKAKKSGLSREQIPVLVAQDRQGRVVDAVLPNQTKAAIKQALGRRLGKDNILCIDGGNGLWGYVNDESIPFKLIAPAKHVHEQDPIFPIQSVNGYHSRLKKWMSRFNGVATKYLPNYLGWRRMYEKSQAVLTPTAWIQAAMGRPNQHTV